MFYKYKKRLFTLFFVDKSCYYAMHNASFIALTKIKIHLFLFYKTLQYKF